MAMLTACRSCNAGIPDGAEFCPGCGQPHRGAQRRPAVAMPPLGYEMRVTEGPRQHPRPATTNWAKWSAILLGVGSLAALGGFVLWSSRGEASLSYQCHMNGLGGGTCSFTNTGQIDGWICGSISLQRAGTPPPDPLTSGVFCSGAIAEMTTTKADFVIVGASDYCEPEAGKQWTDVCQFTFARTLER